MLDRVQDDDDEEEEDDWGSDVFVVDTLGRLHKSRSTISTVMVVTLNGI